MWALFIPCAIIALIAIAVIVYLFIWGTLWQQIIAIPFLIAIVIIYVALCWAFRPNQPQPEEKKTDWEKD